MDEDECEPQLFCEHCHVGGARRVHQGTRFVEEDRNWKVLCEKCAEENSRYWADMFSDFYSDCL